MSFVTIYDHYVFNIGPLLHQLTSIQINPLSIPEHSTEKLFCQPTRALPCLNSNTAIPLHVHCWIAQVSESVSENRMFLKIEFLRLNDKKHVSHVRVFNQLKCGNVCFGQKEIYSYTFFGILLSKIDFGKSCSCFAFGKVFRKIH